MVELLLSFWNGVARLLLGLSDYLSGVSLDHDDFKQEIYWAFGVRGDLTRGSEVGGKEWSI